MNANYRGHCRSLFDWRHRAAPLTLLLALMAAPLISTADTLTLAHAELLATGQDPAIRTVESRQRMLEEQSRAADRLPNPEIRLGVAGLPADSFHLGQEAMTQVQLGVMQMFPRGDSRQLRSRQFAEKSDAESQRAADLRLQTLLSVREAYYEVLRQRRLSDILAEALTVFSDLERITQDYYATGRVQQQDVLRASVEHHRVRDQATRIAQQEDQARSRLATWIGDAAFLEIHDAWPEPLPVLSQAELRNNLADHPRLRALQLEVRAAETGVELAEQGHRPQFSVDLAWGARGGLQPDGRDRSDLLSFMVRMDLPLFSARQQDHLVAANVEESSGARWMRDDVHRHMLSQIEFHSASLARELERIALFEETLLPDAAFNAEATYEAYQSSVESLSTLMRARITEYELRQEYVRLLIDAMLSRARLNYLQGESA